MAEYQPGDRVAEFQYGFSGDGRVQLTTVERLTATQIITATGARFRRDSGYAVGGSRTQLLAPDAQQVRSAIAGAALSSLRFEMDRLLKDAKPGDAVALLDRAEALVRAARAQVSE